jgi:hypothetical protein
MEVWRMFLLYNIVGWSLVELGLADEFVEIVKVIDLVLWPLLSALGIGG